MPQVASEAIAHTLSPSFRQPRSGLPAGPAPASAFENLLDKNIQAAADRSGADAPGNNPVDDSADHQKADTRVAAGGRADATRPDDQPSASAVDNKSADETAGHASSNAGSSTADPDQAAAAADATAESDTTAQIVTSAETAAPGESADDGQDTDADAGPDSGEHPVRQEKLDPNVITGTAGADGKATGAANTDTTPVDAPAVTTDTSAAIAPVATAAAYSENAAHTPDVVAGRASPAAVTALEAAAGKPADAHAEGDGQKAAAPGLPAADGQPKAEDVSRSGGRHPVAPDNDMPARSARSAATDNGAPAQPNHVQPVVRGTPDAVYPLPLTPAAQQPTPAHGPAATAHAPPPAAPPAAMIAGVAIEIAGKALAGSNRFEIRLDPPELGRIEVRLDVARDGRVTSHLVVDRADTLNLLQRDAAALQRALQDAGLKAGDNGLHFSLRDHATGHHDEQNDGRNPMRLVVQDDSMPRLNPVAGTRLVGRNGGIDIRV